MAGNRIITFQVMAGSATSNESLALISVEPIIVPPEVVVGANIAYQEGGAPVNIAPELSIASKDATSPFLSSPETLYGAEIQIVNYVAGEDVLSFIATGNITGEFDEVEGRLVLFGESSYDEYEAVIRSITYFNASEVPTTTAREFKIRLLESGANGMANQTITTQIVVGLPDPVSLLSGAADDIRVLQNEDFVLLGLEDLVYSSPAVSEFSVGLTELRFTVSKLPLASLGQIVFEDGTDLELNKPYPISQLAGLRFEPTLGATGSSEFTYTIAVADSDSGNIETSGLTDTLSISVEGIVTNSPEQAFIAQAYRDLLNRNIDQATLTLLTTNLEEKLKRVDRSKGFESEADARESLLGELVGTEAYRTELIQGLYQSLMLRAATSEELATRMADLANGVQLDDVRLLLIASGEYFELHNETGYESYLDAVYEALLDRKPTATERADGVVRLQKGQPLLDAVKAIGSWASLSQSDQRSLITDLLNRGYEFDDQFDFDFSSRQSLLHSIIASDEYYARVSTPTNSTTVATHVTSDFPSVGILGDLSGGKAGGTLIAPQYVLVAAHSVVGVPKGQLTFEIGGKVHRIAEVIVHPDFNPDVIGSDGGNDIALLKLDTAVVGIEPALFTGRSPRLGESLKLVGFGEHEGDTFGTKRVGSTPPVDEVSSEVFRWTQTNPTQNDSDAGDSGSPLFSNVNGTDLIIGIVMGGASNIAGVGSVATNTRIDGYLAWIQSIVPSVVVADVNDPPSLLLEDLTLYLDENSGLHLVGFEVSASDAVTFDVTTTNSAMFRNLESTTKVRA